MKRKGLCVAAAVALLFAGTQVMAGTPQAPAGALPTTLRVLVGVDVHGKVIKASPATAVSPAVEHALLRTLARAITRPAVDAAGKSMPSSFVMHLALHTARATDGNYRLAFDYLSTTALPAGAWVWCRTRGQPHLVNVGSHPDACPALQRTVLGRDLLRTSPRGPYVRDHDTRPLR